MPYVSVHLLKNFPYMAQIYLMFVQLYKECTFGFHDWALVATLNNEIQRKKINNSLRN